MEIETKKEFPEAELHSLALHSSKIRSKKKLGGKMMTCTVLKN